MPLFALKSWAGVPSADLPPLISMGLPLMEEQILYQPDPQDLMAHFCALEELGVNCWILALSAEDPPWTSTFMDDPVQVIV